MLPLWKQLDAGEDAVSGAGPRHERCAVRVWRKGVSIFHASMQPDEERCLEALASGSLSLAELGETLAGAEPSGVTETGLAERFAALLDLWTQDEILAPRPD